MQIDANEIEELSAALYVRALKLLPGDIKQGFERLVREETDATGRAVLGTMVENIAIAERTKNILCQDTGIPIYNVTIGRNVTFDGAAMHGGDPARLRARHARSAAALLRRASDHAQERADLVRRARADRQFRFLRARGDGRDRDDPERIGLGERLVPADADPGRRRECDQALRHRPCDRMRRPRVPADHRGRRHRGHVGFVHASGEDRGDASAGDGMRRSRRARRSSASFHRR